jgi:hypothetical protein
VGPQALTAARKRPFEWEVRVAHGVHPSVKEVEATVADADVHGVAGHPAHAQFVE